MANATTGVDTITQTAGPDSLIVTDTTEVQPTDFFDDKARRLAKGPSQKNSPPKRRAEMGEGKESRSPVGARRNGRQLK